MPAYDQAEASAIEADSEGNVFVAGRAHNNETNSSEFVTIKYDGATGDTLWTSIYNGSASAQYIVIDGAGNVFVAGSTLNGSLVVKYNGATGAQIWSTFYRGSANISFGASGIAIDAAGNVFIAGYSYNGHDYDFATLKYDGTSGAQSWATIYNSPANSDEGANGLVVDADGNVFVTGFSNNGTNNDFATIKYDGATGSQIWNTIYNGDSNNNDNAHYLAVDAVGNVLVLGESFNTTSDYAILKYDGATGEQIWATIADSPSHGSEFTRGITVDAAGNVFIIGGTIYTSNFDTFKYNGATGEQLWAATYYGPQPNADQPSDLVVDALGNVYVTGYSAKASGREDYATVKHDGQTGQIQWVARYDDQAQSRNRPKCITLDANNNVFVSGRANDEFATIKYAQVAPPPGPTVWTGASSTIWYDAANWTDGTPTATRDAVIPEGTTNSPVIGPGSYFVHDLTLNNSTLTISGGSLTISGSLTNNGGTLTQNGEGELAFDSDTPQVLGGSGGTVELTTLTVGEAGIELSGPVEVQQVLTLQGDLISNGFLVLRGDENGTAMVIPSGDGVIIGDVTVQVYVGGTSSSTLSAAKASALLVSNAVASTDRYLQVGSPVVGATIADLATPEYTPVINPAFNSLKSPTAKLNPVPTVFRYAESLATSGFWRGWQSPTALSNSLTIGSGYNLRISNATKFELTGTLNTGTISSPALTRMRAEGGWQLLSNPYPSLLDWRVIVSSLPANSSLGRALYVYDNATGAFRYYVNGIGNPLVDVMQGFWVRVVGPVGGAATTFNFTDAARRADFPRAADYVPAPNSDTRPVVQLTVRTNAGATDQTVVYFDSQATTTAEAKADAWKIPTEAISPLLASNSRPIFGSWAGTELLAVNGLPALGTKKVSVPLSLEIPQAMACTISASLSRIPTNMDVLLVDQVSSKTINLGQVPAPSYSFQSTTNNMKQRFTLQLAPKKQSLAVTSTTAETLRIYPQPAREEMDVLLPEAYAEGEMVRVQLVNIFGRVVLDRRMPAAQAGTPVRIPVRGQRSGVYTLRISSAQSVQSQRVEVE
ncbi:SBBP repeat-containing protein [Hymenobacter sp. BT730]|uniref:SBBP repeat-containing protein n=1 Tax=Hymenobacter sp. BT730 TaxID=3063332 RepID=UPI0026DEDCED|nr:SBBP repeat-containing protein [Hymenobacter sp. BT730]